ncbi:restriction endonuclease subunit S [Actinokineospora sp. 24-640]
MSELWTEVELGSIASLSFGATPSRNVPHFWAAGEDGHPWASIADLRSDPLVETKERITSAGARASSVSLVKPGTPLMSFKLTIGRVATAGKELYTNEAIVAIDGDRQIVSNAYLAYALPTIVVRAVVDIAVKGATLNKDKLAKLRFLLPPLSEQKEFVEVLRSTDESIRSSKRVIEKLEKMLNGVANDLFKPSPGEFWDRRVLDDLIDSARPIVYGILMPGRGVESGVPVVKVKDITDGSIAVDNLQLTSRRIDQEYRRSRLREGDLLFTIRGTVGRRAFVPHSLNGANITQDTARIAISRADPRYVWYFLDRPEARRFIDLHTLGQAVQGINLRDVRSIPIRLPEMKRQAVISSTLDGLSQCIDKERESFSKLSDAKVGIAATLLSGRVRMKAV